jgi:hypothetical protein
MGQSLVVSFVSATRGPLAPCSNAASFLATERAADHGYRADGRSSACYPTEWAQIRRQNVARHVHSEVHSQRDRKGSQGLQPFQVVRLQQDVQIQGALYAAATIGESRIAFLRRLF